MEDVLDVYQRPYDPSRPVVCIDETNKQLILEKRIPCKPGEPEKVDSVYVRNGVADIFMISEPLAGKRETVVKQTGQQSILPKFFAIQQMSYIQKRKKSYWSQIT